MEARVNRCSQMTGIAGVDGSGKVVAERSSVDSKGLDATEADGIMYDRLVGR
jgi:hypothetical protein